MKVKEALKLMNEAVQLRKPNEDKVDEYAEKMANGAKFPAVIMGYWPKTEKYGESGIVDGVQRLLAAEKAGAELDIESKKFPTFADALAYAYEANQAHGLPVTEGQRNKRILLLRQVDSTMSIAKLSKIFGLHQSSIDRILKGDQGEGKSGPKNGTSKSKAHASKDPMKASAIYKTIVKLNNEFVRKRPAQLLELAGYLSPITETAPEGEVDKERVAEVTACAEHLLAVIKLLK